jgi:hypothetical protein
MTDTSGASAGAPPDTGGVDIGTWGQIGGRIPGLHAIASAASDVGPLAVWRMQQRKAAKGFDDRPEANSVGSDNGQIVKSMGDAAGDI